MSRTDNMPTTSSPSMTTRCRKPPRTIACAACSSVQSGAAKTRSLVRWSPAASRPARRWGLLAASRADLGLALIVVTWVGVVLPLDNAGSARELLLGLVTWGLLLGLLARESSTTRAQVAVVVAFATLIEY